MINFEKEIVALRLSHASVRFLQFFFQEIQPRGKDISEFNSCNKNVFLFIGKEKHIAPEGLGTDDILYGWNIHIPKYSGDDIVKLNLSDIPMILKSIKHAA